MPQPEPAPHPEPVICQTTPWSEVPRTVAVNCCVARGASVTDGGETLTTTKGRMVTWDEALWVASAWLVAVTVTGFRAGTEAGAR